MPDLDSDVTTPLLRDDASRWVQSSQTWKFSIECRSALFTHWQEWRRLFFGLSNCKIATFCLNLSSDDSLDEDYGSRWRSIRVMYFTMFLSSVGEDSWKHLENTDMKVRTDYCVQQRTRVWQVVVTSNQTTRLSSKFKRYTYFYYIYHAIIIYVLSFIFGLIVPRIFIFTLLGTLSYVCNRKVLCKLGIQSLNNIKTRSKSPPFSSLQKIKYHSSKSFCLPQRC